jgi:hypothetical protein
MAIITVATALTVFATDALVVGARNRDDRARVESGAEAVLITSTTDVTTLRQGVRAADPSGTLATPVVEVRQGSSAAMTTLAVVPDQFARIAELPRDAGVFPWDRIAGGPAPQIILTGRSLSVTVSDSTLSMSDRGPSRTPLPGTPPDRDLSSSRPSLLVFLAQTGAAPFTVNLGDLPVGSAAAVTLSRDVACADGCRVSGFALAPPSDLSGLLKGTFTLGAVSIDGSPPAPVGDAAQWLPSGEPNAPASEQQAYAKAVDVGDPTRIGLDVQTRLDLVRVTARGSTIGIPALVAGSLPNEAPGPGFQAAGLDGIALDFTRVAAIPYAPGGAPDQAIVNLDVLATRATELPLLSQAQVWVADAAAVPAVSAALTKAGVGVRSVELRSERAELFDRSASSWGLRLALVVGLLALAIAALVLVLVAVTSWRTRSRDYAALRMAGVGTPTLRRVSLAEQWTVVVVSVAVGALSGVLGAQLAMPIIPFFTTPSTVLPVDTAPAVVPVVVAVLAALVVLLAVGTIVGIRLVGRASLSRVREQL